MGLKNKANIALEFETSERDDYPRCVGHVTISATTNDGLSFESVVKYDGNSAIDVVKTLVRKEAFHKCIADLAIVIMTNDEQIGQKTPAEPSFDDLGEDRVFTAPLSHPPEWYESREKYFENESNRLLQESYSGLRYYVSNAGLNIPIQNGADRHELVKKIIQAVMEKEEEYEKNKQP